MSVRKRSWRTEKGEAREAYIVDYVDAAGHRHIKTFDRKKDALAYEATVKVDVASGVHVAPSKSLTVAAAGEKWLAACEAAELERTTIASYRGHLNLHILPYLGRVRLSELTVALIRDWQDKLRNGTPAPGSNEAAPRSADMVRRVTRSLGTLLADAMERGSVGQNVVHALVSNRRGKDRKALKRAKGKLKIGVDIPEPDEIRSILACATGKWRPFLMVATFCGLRASEIRGLRWCDIDFKKGELHVRQRADQFNKIGVPKSESGERAVPVPAATMAALREWKMICPRRDTGRKDANGKPVKELHFVFPNGRGEVENYSNVMKRGINPTQLAAGVCVLATDDNGARILDKKGKPVRKAKYGLHGFRHFYASWCINRRADGGLELPLKLVSERLGHSTIALTADTYGHLFARGDDTSELTIGERLLLS